MSAQLCVYKFCSLIHEASFSVLLVNDYDSFFQAVQDVFVPCAEELCINISEADPAVKYVYC